MIYQPQQISNDAVRSLTQDTEPIVQAPAKKGELEEIAVEMPKQPFREDCTDHILEEDLASLVPTQADLEPTVSAIEADNLQNWITLVPTSDSNPEQLPEEIIEDNQPAISEHDLELESYDQSIDPPDLMISVESNNLNISAFEEKAPNSYTNRRCNRRVAIEYINHLQNKGTPTGTDTL